MANNNSVNLENNVMSEIKSGRVKIRSKYIFIAEKLGLGSAFALSVLLAVLFFNLALFYLKSSDNMKYLSFGSRGLFAFLESFPYVLIIGLIILVFIAAIIFKKSGVLYDKPFGTLAVGLVCLIMVLGVVLTFTDLAERMERRAFGPHPDGKFFRPLFTNGFNQREGGIAGRVVEIGEDFIRVQTPHDTFKIDLSGLERPVPKDVAVGSFVLAVGERKAEVFEAKDIHVVNEGEIPMIGRGVHRLHGNFRPPMPPMPEGVLPTVLVPTGTCGADCMQ